MPSSEICKIRSSLPDLGLQEEVVRSREQRAESREQRQQRQQRQQREQLPEGDRDLVDFLDDEAIVVEDDSLGDRVRLGTLLQVTVTQNILHSW